MTKKTSTFIIILVIIIAISFLWFFWKHFKTPGIVSFTTDKIEYERGEVLKLKVKNDSLKKICFSNCYPYYLERKNSNWESYKYEECRSFNGNGHCLEAGREKAFELTLPSVSAGIHRLAIPVCSDCENEAAFQEEKRFYSNEFSIKEKETEGVTVITDKTEYGLGETVKITVDNNLDKGLCFEPCNNYYLEKKNSGWELDQESRKLCGINLPIEDCIKAGESRVFDLETVWGSYQKTTGIYRAVVTICIDCEDLQYFQGDKTVYSNEFTIK